MLKFPPDKVNIFNGYKRPSSMTVQERWDFAQKHGAKVMLMLRCGVLLLLVSAPGLFYRSSEGITIVIGLVEVIVVIVAMIARVEKALK